VVNAEECNNFGRWRFVKKIVNELRAGTIFLSTLKIFRRLIMGFNLEERQDENY
jgi:hypothetical protein